MAEQNKFLLVDLSVLPEVFTKVVEAKRYMAQGKAEAIPTRLNGWNFPQRLL